MGPSDVMLGGAVLILGLAAGLWHARLTLAQVREALAKAELKVASLEGQQFVGGPDVGRVSAIEQDLDALHQQMERLAEGQDFLTRVLTQQGGLPHRLMSPAPQEQITPH